MAESVTTKQQYTPLLTNAQLARVERLRINSSRRFTNRARGEHVKGKGGASTDFADYRNYVSGDDLRFVDWNIFSRLHRPYLKLFQQEQEMHVVVLLDASSSMNFEGKFDMAKKFAAAFSVMGLFANERVSVHAFNQSQGAMSFVGPVTGRGSMRKIFRFIENIEPGGDASPDAAVDRLLSRHRGRGVVALISDLLTFGDLRKCFNSLHSHGLEIFATQILSPTEMDPEVGSDLRLVDSETSTTLDISAAGDLASIYQEYRLAYERHVEGLARQRNGKFISVSSGDTFENNMFDLMRRRGWVV